ncbi:MAG: DUF3363 domain-containing protein, partial [Polyangiaceae bacterium]
PLDRHIAESARNAGGVFEVDPAGEEPFRGNVVRRLRELEKFGLAAQQGPDRWRVADDLIDRLARHPRSEPSRERIWIQKLPVSLEAAPGHRGPCWVDRAGDQSLAPWGFGFEVKRAADQRREVLRGLGIAHDDPRRDAKLQEIERRAVGEGMAARTRQQFLAQAPDGFRGRVMIGPERAPYAVITDGSRFVLVPASRELRDLANQNVVVSRDDKGRLLTRAFERGMER